MVRPSRRSGGHAPPGKCLKTDAPKWLLEAILLAKLLSPFCLHYIVRIYPGNFVLWYTILFNFISNTIPVSLSIQKSQ